MGWQARRRCTGEGTMSTTIIGTFATRREADMAVERLVQEHGIERTDIFIAADGDDNTAGEERAGADDEPEVPSSEDEGDPALNGRIEVSVDIEDDTLVERVRDAFSEFEAVDVRSI